MLVGGTNISQVGSGKTVLFSSAVERVRHLCQNEPSSYLGYFYLTSRGPSGQDIANLLRFLIVQLCPPAEVPEPVRTLFESCNEGFPPRLPTIQELANTLRGVLVSSKPHIGDGSGEEEVRDFYLLIDGLDELQWSIRDDLFQSFDPIIALQLTNIRLLFTSRYRSDIRVQPAPNHAPWNQVNIDIDSIQSDIAKFVSREVSAHTRLQRLDQDIKDAIMQRVAFEANGMYAAF